MVSAKNALDADTGYEYPTNTGNSPDDSLAMILFYPYFCEDSFATSSVGDIAQIFPL